MFSIIVAMSQNGIIGKDNSLLWNIPDDLKRFKEITMGKTILMGRKTFESLPFILPGRKHIVLTRDINFKINHPKVKVFYDIDSILNKYTDSDNEVFIIGGGEIYKEFIKHSTKLYITEVLCDFTGDTSFPVINYENWHLVYESPIYLNNSVNFKFKDYILL